MRVFPDPSRSSRICSTSISFLRTVCPYCSFNRFPFAEEHAVPYFKNLRREMMMVKELGYDFDSLYIGGGTPTIVLDELCETIDLAKVEVLHQGGLVRDQSEPPDSVVSRRSLQGRVDRMSVGVQSFDDGLLKQMDRYDKYGSGRSILESIKVAAPYFKSLNVDMIFNFPAQTEEILRRDLEMVLESGTSQTTFYPLMASPSVEKSLAATVGKVDYEREQRFYEIISGTLGGRRESAVRAWVGLDFQQGGSRVRRRASRGPQMIDEYIVDYEEYPAIGSGGMTYLGATQYVNTFSVREYNEAIESGRMSLMGKATFSKRNRMRYRFMMQLFGLRLDKKQWQRDFGCSVAAGLAGRSTPS